MAQKDYKERQHGKLSGNNYKEQWQEQIMVHGKMAIKDDRMKSTE